MSEEESKDLVEILQNSLVGIVTESWRFSKLFHRLLEKLDAGEKGRYLGQYNWYLKNLEKSLFESKLSIVNLEGQEFDPGMAATPLNMDEFKDDDILIVDQMLEPIIMGPGGIVKTGTVTLRKI